MILITRDGRIGHVDMRDVATVAAEIAASPAAHTEKTYWPTAAFRRPWLRDDDLPSLCEKQKEAAWRP